MASYEAYLGVGIDASGAQQGAAQVNSAMDKVSAAAKKAAKETAYYQQQLDSVVFAAKAFAAATAALVVREIGSYTQAMSNARAMTQGNEEDMKRLAVVVRDLGKSTAFSATQVADAAATLGQAGFSIDKIMGTLPAVLDLAAAAAVDMATAADITAGAMASFGMNADQATHATDVLAAVATGVKTDIRGLGEALKAIGPSAQQVGWTLEDTSAILGVMAQKNLEGSMSGTALKAAIGSLVAPSRMARSEIKALGMDVNLLNPNMVSGIELFKNLAKSTIDAEGVFRIFGKEAANGVFAVISSIRELDRVKGVIDNAAGATKKMAEIKLDNLWGDVEQLGGALSELALKVGDTGVEGAMRKFVQAAAESVDWLAEIAVEATKSKDTFWLLQSSVELLAFSAGSLVTVQLATWLYGVAAAAHAAYLNTALFSATLYGLPITWVVAALAALGFAIYKIATNWEYVGEVAHNTIMAMYNGIKRFAAGVIIEFGAAANFLVNRLEWVKEFSISASKQVFYSATGQTQKFFAEQERFAKFTKAQWQDAWLTDSEREDAIDAMLGVKAKEQVTKAGTDLFRAFRDAFKSGALEEYVSGAVANAKSIYETILSAIPKFSGEKAKSTNGTGMGGDKKESMMEGELRNMQLAVELAKNLGMAESELYRIRLNAQALQDARENGQKSISATTQKQIEQAVALKAEEDKLTTVYETRKGLDDNLNARLKTAMEAVSVAQNMGASEADLLRMTLESQASEAARKMGLQGINAEMQTMIDKIVTLAGLATDYKKAYENDEASKDYLQGLRDRLAEEQKRADLMKQYKGDISEVDTQMQIYNDSKRQGITLTETQIAKATELINEKKKLSAEEVAAAEASKKATESQKQWNNQLTSAFKDAIMNSKNLGDALSNLANRVQDMLVNKALDSLLGGMFASMKFAKGAAFQAGGVTAFASGGVVGSPTMFPMRGGRMGLMGEAGAEAIMPLTRTSSGDLGVKAVGAGTVVNTSININVTGGTKEQNEDAGKRVSAAVRQAIDDTVVSVIMREKRPGGVLNAA